MIESGLLMALSPKLGGGAAAEIAAALWTGCEKFEITTPRRVAAFLGQCAHESRGFTTTEEDLRYRPERLLAMWPRTPKRLWGFVDLADAQAVVAGGPRAIANRIYGTRLGNRPGTDDGWDHRGSGYIQLTGLGAFTEYENDCGEPILADPSVVRRLPHAARSACWVFGSWKKLNGYADAWNIETIGARINGTRPPYGAEDRLQLSELALEHLGG